MRYGRLNESDEYLAARETLRLAEAELLTHRERVAKLRRELPPGASVVDQIFLEGPRALDMGDEPITEVSVGSLFSSPGRPLVLFQMMYGKAQTQPCPMCTMWLDGLNGVAHHLEQNVDFAVLAAAEPAALRAHGRDRGWDRVRLLGAGESTFKFDTGSEDAEGNQSSTISVLDRDPDGTIRHAYSAHPQWSDEDHQRGLDLLSPVWNVLDLTRQGRADWYASLRYS